MERTERALIHHDHLLDEEDQEELERFLGKMFPGDGDMYEKQLKMMIEGLDEDGDGTVTEEEFLTMMIPIVEAEEENVEIGVVAKRMFEILDDDHSGEITTSEFKETLEKMGVMMSYEEVRELFHEYDDNLDGVMDEEEFIKMMCHQL
jgi:Ca2+-binding EF-hand superfamily protein